MLERIVPNVILRTLIEQSPDATETRKSSWSHLFSLSSRGAATRQKAVKEHDGMLQLEMLTQRTTWNPS
jgi:hypothetical protein